jgi:phage replication O-like protein O
MASPQLDNGYTKIANEILDALISHRLSGQEYQVTLYIIRKTYGFQKKCDYISMGQIAKATGIVRTKICKLLNNLYAKNIIGVVQKGNSVVQKGNTPLNCLYFSKDYELWKTLPKKVGVVQKGNTMCGTIVQQGVVQKDNKGVVQKGTHKRKKETLTKEIKHIYGEFKNVKLSSEQYQKLIAKLGDAKTQDWITTLDEGIELKGYKYRNHYLAILKWITKAQKEGDNKIQTLPATKPRCVYDNAKPCYGDCTGCSHSKKDLTNAK